MPHLAFCSLFVASVRRQDGELQPATVPNWNALFFDCVNPLTRNRAKNDDDDDEEEDENIGNST